MTEQKSFIEELDEFLTQQNAEKTPAKKPKHTPHKKAIKAICKALRGLDPKPMITVRNVGVTQFRDPKTRKQVKYTYGRKGEGDIDLTWLGQAFELEVKVGSDIQRPSQIEHQKRFEAAGGVYFIVSTPEQAIEYLQAWRRQRYQHP